MGGGWPVQRRIGDLDDINDWITQRNADVALRQEADRVGRSLWDQATRDGQDLSATQPSDLVALGADALRQTQPTALDAADQSDPDSRHALVLQQTGGDLNIAPQTDPGPIVATPPNYGFATARPGDSISRLLGRSDPGAVGRFLTLNGMDGRSSALQIGQSYAVPTRYDDATPEEVAAGHWLLRLDSARLASTDAAANGSQANLFAQRLNSGLNVWTGEAPDDRTPSVPPAPTAQPGHAPWWDRNGVVKGLSGEAGLRLGRGLGALRGGAHVVGGAIDGVGLVARLAMPQRLDEMLSPPGMSARAQVTNAITHGLDYVDRAKADPRIPLNDLQDFASRKATDLLPEATPPANTALGEFGRNLRIGANQGELGANVGALVLGGEGLEGLSAMRLAAEPVAATKFAELYPQAEEYFNKPYSGIGHHYFSQNNGKFVNMGGAPLPQPIRTLKIPRILRNNELFRYRPSGIKNAEMFGRHVQVDPQYFGGKIPDEYGGGGWSGAQLGLEKLSPLGRRWHGASVPLRASVGAGVLGGAVVDSYLNDWSGR